MPVTADVQTLEPGTIVTLFELDAAALGGETYRFHGMSYESDVLWQGETYSPWAIEASGFEMTSEGQQASPTLQVANLDGFVTALVLFFDDLVGAKLTRRRTLAKYLDGQPEADPNEHMPDELWYVERKVGEDHQSVKFELASPLDFENVQIPRRQIIANSCSWLSIGGYRGPYCGYNGPPVATADDIITTDATKDVCGGRVTSCKLRFGEEAQLPYGGFPAAGLVR